MATRRQDLWDTCYEGEHRQLASPQQFAEAFCARCQNSGCTRSMGAQTKWQHRMDTQEDLLLRNPRFAEEDDPRFRDIRQQEFNDAVRQALAIEVSNAKGDWSIPTDTEIATMAASVVGFVPPPVYSKPEPAPPEPPKAPEPPPTKTPPVGNEKVEIEEWVVKGDKKNNYNVRKTGDEWSCTCSGFVHRKACKHIEDVKRKYDRTKPPPPVQEAPVEVGPRRMPEPESWAQAMARGKLPKAQNTAVPPEGIWVGGPPENQPSPPNPGPVADPWAAPTPKVEMIIPVGGRVILGGGTGKKP